MDQMSLGLAKLSEIFGFIFRNPSDQDVRLLKAIL